MPNKILVIDADPESIQNTEACLREDAHEVVLARSGMEALKKAEAELPELIMLDIALPDMEWSELARSLRTRQATQATPIVLVADSDHLDDLMVGQQSYADDFIVKPFSPAELRPKLSPLLKNKKKDRSTVVSTGNAELDSKIGGGIPLGSLSLIEGSSGAGKSVLVQQLIWGSLQGGFALSLFTSENTVKSLVRQMSSLSLGILDFLLLNRLRVYPIEVAQLGSKAPVALLKAMRQEKDREMIFVDSLTAAIAHCSDEDVLRFFEGAKRLCADGMTVLVILHSHGLTKELLIRLRSLCDAHLQLRSEEMGQKLVRTLEVTKIRGADKTTGNIISFEVEPGWGMRLIPISRVKG